MYLDLHPHERDATEIWRPITSDIDPRWEIMEDGDDDAPWPYWPCYVFAEPSPVRMECPYGNPGDVLACREEWCPLRASDYEAASRSVRLPQDREKVVISYRSDHFDPSGDAGPLEWRPASEMPDWAIRRHVTVRQVEVRRVSTITEAEAATLFPIDSEGEWMNHVECGVTYRQRFREWWDSAFPAHPWASEPWCWRVVAE